MKQIIKNYTFNTTAKTITLTDLVTVRLDRLQLVTDVTTGVIIYNFASTAQTATVLGNVITLSALPGGVANTDQLQIIYDTLPNDPSNDAAAPYNIFRDPFNSMDTTRWVFTNKAASDLMYVGGNVASASWVSIVKSALVADTYSEIVSTQAFPVTLLASVGITMSQRIFAQEFAFDFVGVDSAGAPINSSSVADVAIANTGVGASGTLLTYTSSVAHGLLAGDTVTIFGAADPRLNFSPIVVQTIPSATTFTISSTLGAATYQPGANAKVRYQPPDAYATYIMSQRFVGNSHNNIDALTKSGDRLPQIVNWNPGNTATSETYPSENGVNYNSVPYVYPQRTREEFVNWLGTKSAKFLLKDIDTVSATRGVVHRSHNIPDDSRKYKIRFRGANLASYTPPVGNITAITKSGSAVATVTIPSHGLTTSDYVSIVGVRDQTNFGNNASASVVVASVIDANTFTVSFGTSVTASSYGGMAMRASQGGTSILPTVTTNAVTTYAKTADGLRLSLVFGATQGTLFPGEIWTVYGLVDSTNTAQTALYGRYRVEFTNATTFTVELTPLDGQSISAVSTTPANAGGLLIKNTELRLHFARVESANSPQQVELIGGSGDVDQSTAIPVNLNSQNVNALVAGTTPSAISTQAARTALGTLSTAPVTNVDRGSAAITANNNSGVISTDFGANLSALVNVTAVSGTAPTLDIVLQESFDNGTTFQDSYWLPRITATGSYPVPGMTVNGRRRWNYIVGGTSPSITFSITTMSGGLPTGLLRSFYDRTIAPNTVSSTTPTYNAEGCTSFELIADMGAITTTAPTLQLQGSETGTSGWRNIGAPLVPIASAVSSEVISGYQPRFVRATVSSAGSGATLNSLQIKATSVSSIPTGTSPSANSVPVVAASDQAPVKNVLTNSSSTAVSTANPADAASNAALALNVNNRDSTWNGTSWDRTYSATAAAGTTGTGVKSAGLMGFDGTNYQRVKTDTSGNALVVQPTAANFNATVVGTGTFATQATLSAGSNNIGSITNITGSVIPGTAATNLGKAEDAPHASGDTGVLALAVRNDNAATAMTSANGDYGSISTDLNGTVFTRQAPSTTATTANVAGATTSGTLLTANPARRAAIFVNDSTAILYLKYGSAASSSSFTYLLNPSDTLTIAGEEYAGLIAGVWASAVGNARVTETTI